MTEETLKAQLTWIPPIEGTVSGVQKRVIVGGMGGSALPGHAARFLDNAISISVHSDYEMPEHAPADALCIAISYSGNTEETLSFAKAVHGRGYPLAVIASGGELSVFAREAGVPIAVVPEGLSPRNALFYLLRALLALTNRSALLEELAAVSIDAGGAHRASESLAKELSGGLPLFYASRTNGFLAHAAKIHAHETAKMLAFANVFPELNHNEMESFDTPAPDAAAALARFVLLRDARDDARVIRRMDLFAEMMRTHGRRVAEVPLRGATRAEVLVYGWFVVHLSALALAGKRGVDPDTVPLVEEFKKRL